jgi:hypothetical protein
MSEIQSQALQENDIYLAKMQELELENTDMKSKVNNLMQELSSYSVMHHKQQQQQQQQHI